MQAFDKAIEKISDTEMIFFHYRNIDDVENLLDWCGYYGLEIKMVVEVDRWEKEYFNPKRFLRHVAAVIKGGDSREVSYFPGDVIRGVEWKGKIVMLSPMTPQEFKESYRFETNNVGKSLVRNGANSYYKVVDIYTIDDMVGDVKNYLEQESDERYPYAQLEYPIEKLGDVVSYLYDDSWN